MGHAPFIGGSTRGKTPGNAPPKMPLALERRHKLPSAARPFSRAKGAAPSGLEIMWAFNPGRCPGLSYRALSGPPKPNAKTQRQNPTPKPNAHTGSGPFPCKPGHGTGASSAALSARPLKPKNRKWETRPHIDPISRGRPTAFGVQPRSAIDILDFVEQHSYLADTQTHLTLYGGARHVTVVPGYFLRGNVDRLDLGMGNGGPDPISHPDVNPVEFDGIKI